MGIVELLMNCARIRYAQRDVIAMFSRVREASQVMGMLMRMQGSYSEPQRDD